MTERKVLNKYYPPDFDPSKLPRLRLSKNRQFNVRIMAPCNMKCNTCGEYIYKGKKFNSRQETVDGETHLGLRIYRFYIKCPRCMSEITFKTNLEEMDYELEHGATRNFQAVRLAEQQAEKVEEARVEEEKSNPMIALERRTQDSRHEMDRLEALEELRDLNTRQQNVNYEDVIKMTVEKEMQMLQKQEDDDEAFVRSLFPRGDEAGTSSGLVIKRIHDSDASDDEDSLVRPSVKVSNPTELLASSDTVQLAKKQKPIAPWEKSIGSFGSGKSSLSGIIKRKEPVASTSTPAVRTGPATVSVAAVAEASGKAGGLGMLASYGSSSEEDG